MAQHTQIGLDEGRAFTVTNRMVLSIAAPMTLAFITTPLLGLVDTAVVGRLGDAALIGGLAIAAIIFDIIGGALNFFRSSTTALVAQAFGRGNVAEQQLVFWRYLLLAIIIGLIIIIASPLLIWAGVSFMNPGPDVSAAATAYLSIRLLSTPLALSNYTLLGFLLGQGRAGMGLMLQSVINGVNIVLSFGFGLGLGWGLPGVAWATVIAELAGCLVGLAVVLGRFGTIRLPSMSELYHVAALKGMFALNADVMIRTLALIFAFAWFTRLGTQLGQLQLAANAILLNLFLVSSYYLDGLATAAEQLAGRAIGARYRPAFVSAVRHTVLWGFVLAALSTAFFLLFGESIVALLTTVEAVRSSAATYLPWAALTALTGVLAFQMDGVFIGATWSRDMRNMMLISLVIFIAAAHFLGQAFGNHGLWAALNLWLASRGLGLFLVMPKRMNAAFDQTDAGIARSA